MRIGEMSGKKVNWRWGGFSRRWGNSTSGGEREVLAKSASEMKFVGG